MTWRPITNPRIDIVSADENLRYSAKVCKKLASSAPSTIARQQDVRQFKNVEGRLKVGKVIVYNPTEPDKRRFRIIYELIDGGPGADCHIDLQESEIVRRFNI